MANDQSGTLPSTIPQLNRTDADVLLLFLVNWTPTFVQPVHDPWFQALVPSEQPLEGGAETGVFKVEYYTPSEPVTVLGCSQQMQWCTSNAHGDHTCTPLQGFAPGSYSDFERVAIHLLKLNERQKSIFSRLYEAAWANQMGNIINNLGYNLLLAQQTVIQGFGAGLPDDQ